MRKLSHRVLRRAVGQAALLTVETLERRQLLSAGAPDGSFGSGGLATTDFTGSTTDTAIAATRLNDHQLVILGESNGLPIMARYNADGSRDTSFGSGGVVHIDSSVLAGVAAIAEDSSGNLVVAGNDSSGEAALARFTANGSLDTSFGNSGVTDVPAAGSGFNSVAFDDGGRVIASATGTGDFTAVRLDDSGNLDPAFGNSGIASYDFGVGEDDAFTIANRNGNLLLAGVATQTSSGAQGDTGQDAAFVQFNDNDGSLDGGFNGSGSLVMNGLTYGSATIDAVKVLPTGEVLAAGVDYNQDFFYTKLQPDGEVDSTFDQGTGFGVTNIGDNNITNDFAESIDVDSNGQILVIGNSDQQIAVARYNADGTTDNSYGNNGVFVTNTEVPVTGIVDQTDNSILVIGTGQGAVDSDFAQTKIDSNATLDGSFGTNGVVLDGFTGSQVDAGNAVAQQSDGKLVVAGSTQTSNGDELIALARYNTNGSLDTSFGDHGRVTLSVTGSDIARTVTITSTGQILVGFVASSESDKDFGVAQFNSDGSLDTSFGNHGSTILSTPGQDNEVSAIALSPNEDTIYLAGTQNLPDQDNFEIAGFSTGGVEQFDNTVEFGGGSLNSVLAGMAVQPDGNIVLGGTASDGSTVEFALARVTAGGTTDSSFGGGTVTTSDGGFDAGGAVALDSSGNIYITGFDSTTGDDAVIKFDSSGNRITSGFGDSSADGVAHLTIGTNSVPSSIAIAPSGKIILAGTDFGAVNDNFAIARLNSDGSVDTDFGSGGQEIFSQPLSLDVGGMTLQSDGNTVVAGSENTDDFAIARFDGTGDSVANNPAPVANAGADVEVNEGTTVHFDGTASTGTGLTYAWDLDGDGQFDDSTSPTPSFTYPDGPASITVSLQVKDSQGRTSLDTLTVTVDNVAPTLTVAGAGTANEGSLYTVNLGSSDPGADTISSWTINWGDGHTDILSGNPSSASHTYTDNGNFTIVSSATDEDGTYAAPNSSVAVANVPPTASVSGPSSLMPGQSGTFTLGASDPSSVDQAGNFTFNIDWDGNGTVDQTVVGHAGTTVSHYFTTEGSDTVKVTATDKDGGQSTAASTVVSIAAPNTVTAQVVADPLNAGQTMLLIDGTDGADTIELDVAKKTQIVTVDVNGIAIGSYSPTSRIVVFANGGNDAVTHGGGFKRAVEEYGGDGDDTLKAGQNGDILVGGAGNDSLVSGAGNDVEIGGTGADHIVGDAGQDLLISGTTAYDNDPASLDAISNEWTSARSFDSRVANLEGNNPNSTDFAARLNGNVFLIADSPNATVFDDGVKDTLNGGADEDWLLCNITGGTLDKANGTGSGDVVTDI